MANNQQLLLGEGAGGGPANYIEDVFSTYLYTGNGSTQTITNNIDLSTKGGLVWIKCRNSATPFHIWVDSARGNTKAIYSNASSDQYSEAGLTTLTSSGFSVGAVSSSVINVNATSETYASWSFRKQPKFFDVVTYTGNGVAGRTVAHNLGSVPGFIMVKRTDTSSDWNAYHTSLGATKLLIPNGTDAAVTVSFPWNNTEPTAAVFTVGSGTTVNASGGTYVAYIYAHNAGGFGLAGTDNVISCGSWTGTGSNLNVNLGYEPQWLMFKRTDSTGDWVIVDNMRGFTASGADAYLKPNTSDAETNPTGAPAPNSTGFSWSTGAGATFIYIAIRRGPMKVPTVGTDVFKVETYNQTSASDPAFNLGKVADMGFRRVNDFVSNWTLQSRLTANFGLITNTTAAESTQNFGNWDNNVGWYQGGAITPPYSQANWYGWTFARAPGFFDVVCYTGNGSQRTLNHNLTVAPELMIVKARSLSGGSWNAWTTGFLIGPSNNEYVELNSTSAKQDKNAPSFWGSSYPTASVFGIGPNSYINNTGDTYVAYLFATCAGVSKVGSYTGNGSSQTIACGFTAGLRFVLIKRTDSTGDWYVWDSARGIVAGNDPHLSLNDTAAEVTTDDSVDTDNSGFIVNQLAATNVNVSSATYIFLAIA